MTNSWRRGCWKLGLVSALAVGGAIATSRNCALAQIVPDTTLGAESSIVAPNVTINGFSSDRIDGGAIRGANLFHSFREFNVGEGRGAYFTNPTGIENILSRVTGNVSSTILGRLGVLGSANLFLINPNGIIFGPNASLDINSSFVGSTASSLNFADGTQFSATAPQTTPLLTVSVPIGLQFGGTAGSILNQSRVTNSNGEFIGLNMQPSKTLALVGGNVSLDSGFIVAPGGQVELGGLAGTGTVGLSVDGNNLSLSFPNGVERADVSLTNRSEVNVRSGGGGSITINSRNLDVLAESRLRAGIESDFSFVGSQAGDITLNATEAVVIANNSLISNAVLPRALGNGGNINVTARSLSSTDGARLSASTFGQGNAGNLTIQASDSISLDGVGSNGFSSGVFNNVEAVDALGNGGNISVKTRSLSLTNGAMLSASTFGQGNAGSIFVQADGPVFLANSDIFNNIESGAVGSSGGILIKADSLSLTDGAQLQSLIRIASDTLPGGRGNAGNVSINVRGAVTVTGENEAGYSSAIFSSIQSGTLGNGGNIAITAGALSITDGAMLSASTFGQGNAGSIFVQAQGPVSLANSNIFNNVESGAVGNSGSTSIKAESLSLSNGAQINTTSYGEGNAGNIEVHTSSTELTGTSTDGQNRSALTAETFGPGAAGDVRIYTGKLGVRDGAIVSANVGKVGNTGQGGNLTVNASESVELIGTSQDGQSRSALAAETQGLGAAGNLVINTRKLIVQDGAIASTNARAGSEGQGGNLIVNASESVELVGTSGQNRSALSVQTQGSGDAGQLIINSRRLSIQDGAIVSAVSTLGEGRGGNLTVNASDEVELIGTTADGQFPSALTTETQGGFSTAGDLRISTQELLIQDGAIVSARTFGQGPGGSIFIDSRTIIIKNSGSIAVDSQGTGRGGNIQLQAGILSLDNKAYISAETASNTGGNINLQLQDLLLLRRNSRISTTAGTARAGGDGGNITINAPFIVAIPAENSDISANAFTGKGGRVQINAQGIFGIQFRPQLTPESDITASSEFGISGTVELNTPEVDPSRGLVELPAQVVDPSGLIASGCAAGDGKTASRFVNTGRGGLPPNPGEALSSDAVWEDARLPATIAQQQRSNTVTAMPPSEESTAVEIVPATGWVFNDKGTVTLIAQAPNATPYSFGSTPSTCHAR